jgi:glutathione S-transferase
MYKKIKIIKKAVPALYHNDKLLIESSAIIEYLDSLYP